MAIDPKTGKPYDDRTTRYPWEMQTGLLGLVDNGGEGGGQVNNQAFGYYDTPDYDAEWLKSLGYTGGPVMGGPQSGVGADSVPGQDPAFDQWLKDQGLTLGMSQMQGGGQNGQDLLRLQAFRGSDPFGAEHNWSKDENNVPFQAGMALMALFGGNAAGVAGMAGGAGDAVSGMDLAADAAVGSGNNLGTAASAFNSAPTGFSMAGANGQLLDPSAYEGVTSGGAVPESGGGVTWSEGGYSPPTNAANIDSALGTPGYGASSSGPGGGAAGLEGGGGLLDMLKSGGSGALDWIQANPTQALKLLATVGGGLLSAKSAGGGSGGSGSAYTPKTLPGNFKTSYAPQFQAVQQNTGLLSAPRGQAHSGLWQFQKPQSLLGG